MPTPRFMHSSLLLKEDWTCDNISLFMIYINVKDVNYYLLSLKQIMNKYLIFAGLLVSTLTIITLKKDQLGSDY
jgi:hypothetical protein